MVGFRRNPSSHKRRGAKGWLKPGVQSAARHYSRWALRRGMESNTMEEITASGEPFDMYDFTAAHATLPLGTFVRVTNLNNGRTVMVRVNDRGPFVRGRIIDVSYNTARILDFLKDGVQRVLLDFEECPRSNDRIISQGEAMPSNRPLSYRLRW